MTRHLVRFGLYLVIGYSYFCPTVGGQDLSKEYIRVNGRVIAIESKASNPEIVAAPGATLFEVQSVTLTSRDAITGVPIPMTWAAPNSSDGTFTGPLTGVNSVLYNAPSTSSAGRTVTISAADGAGRQRSLTLTILDASTIVTVAPVSGQPDVYEATATTAGTTNWNWDLSPATYYGSLQMVAGNPINRRQYIPPARNYCSQTLSVRATSLNGQTSTGSGATTRSLAPFNTASPVRSSSQDIVSGGSIEVTANLADFNCPINVPIWEWTLPNGTPGTLTNLGSGRYRYDAPAGIGSITNISLTARETQSNVSGSIAMRILPVGGSVLSVSPSPIKLGPYAGTIVAATVNASNPSFSWSASGAGLNVVASSASSTCVSAGDVSSGSATVNVAVTNPGGVSPASVPVNFAAITDNSAIQARIQLSPSGGGLNLNVGTTAFAATTSGVCGGTQIDWSVTRRNSAGTELSPAGIISSTGVYSTSGTTLAEGDLIIVRAQLRGTTIFNTVGVSQQSSAGQILITPNPLTTSAGAASTQLYATMNGASITTPIDWSVQPGGYGVGLTNQGRFVPPSFLDVPRDFIVRVTEVISGRYGTATVRVNGSCSPNLSFAATPSALAPGDTTVLNVTNTCPGTWSYNYEFTPNIGTWNASTRQYTIPANASAGIIAAKATLLDNQGQPSTFVATTNITVALLPAVTINPAGPVNLFPGQSQLLTATVANATNTGVSWSITPAAPSGSTASGNNYTFAASTVAADQTHTLTATSLQDGTRIRTVSITRKAVTVSISGGPSSLSTAQTATYTAATNFGGVTWSVTPTTFASINSTSGLLTAGSGFSTAQAITVTATSTTDVTKSASIAVTLNPGIVVTNIRPTTVYYKSTPTQMLADVLNTANTGLTWFLPEANSSYGSITTSGAYSAPFTTTDLNVLMQARSVADTSKTTITSIAVRPGISADSLSPASGTGLSQIFTSTLTLRDLSSSLDTVYINITQNLTGSEPTCSGSWVRATNKFYLFNFSNGTNLEVTPGGSQSTSQCTLFATGSTASYVNNVATVAFNFTFNANFTGAKQVYLYGLGANGTATGGHVAKGTWTIPAPPVSVSISPASQVTLQATQTQTYTASATSGGIVWSRSPAVGTLSTTSGTSTVFTAPSPISTGQYITIRATSSIDATRWAESTIYLTSVPPPPTVISVTPINGAGSDPSFVLSASHPSGGGNISSIALSLAPNSSSINAQGSCSISIGRFSAEEWYAGIAAFPPYYEYQQNWLYQFNGNTLTSDTCTANGSEMNAGPAGGNLFSATIPMHFHWWVNGTYQVYAYVGGSAGWQYFGTWTKP